MADFADDVTAARYPWRDLMQRWSELWLGPDQNETDRRFPDSAHQQQWLGRDGAGEARIAALEERLGAALPPSYRQFLSVSDGWSHVDDHNGPLLTTTEVGWLRDLDPETVEIWGKDEPTDRRIPDEQYFIYGEDQDCIHVRPEYFRTALQVTEWGDACYLLLNPAVVDDHGEWEAWSFATWYPGAFRYRSFWELMKNTIEMDYPDADWSPFTL
jgi:hypothetical protein